MAISCLLRSGGVTHSLLVVNMIITLKTGQGPTAPAQQTCFLLSSYTGTF